MTFGVLNLYKLFLRSTVPTPPPIPVQQSPTEGRSTGRQGARVGFLPVLPVVANRWEINGLTMLKPHIKYAETVRKMVIFCESIRILGTIGSKLGTPKLAC